MLEFDEHATVGQYSPGDPAEFVAASANRRPLGCPRREGQGLCYRGVRFVRYTRGLTRLGWVSRLFDATLAEAQVRLLLATY